MRCEAVTYPGTGHEGHCENDALFQTTSAPLGDVIVVCPLHASVRERVGATVTRLFCPICGQPPAPQADNEGGEAR